MSFLLLKTHFFLQNLIGSQNSNSQMMLHFEYINYYPTLWQQIKIVFLNEHMCVNVSRFFGKGISFVDLIYVLNHMNNCYNKSYLLYMLYFNILYDIFNFDWNYFKKATSEPWMVQNMTPLFANQVFDFFWWIAIIC